VTSDAPVARAPRTAAATETNRRRAARRTCVDLVRRLDDVEDRTLAVVTERLIVECAARGIDVAELVGE
jgi:hypothetical protein